MEKSIFEQMGGTYHKQGDYFLPNLAVPENDKPSIGVWGHAAFAAAVTLNDGYLKR